MSNEWDDWLRGKISGRKNTKPSSFYTPLFGQHELPGRIRFVNSDGSLTKDYTKLGLSRKKLFSLLQYINENILTTGKKQLQMSDGTQIFLKESEGNTRIDVIIPGKVEGVPKKLRPRRAIQWAIVPCYQVITEDRVSDGYIPVREATDGIGLNFEKEEWKEGPFLKTLPPRLFDPELAPDLFIDTINECSPVNDHTPGLYMESQTRAGWDLTGPMCYQHSDSPKSEDWPNYNRIFHPDGTQLAGENAYPAWALFQWAGGHSDIVLPVANIYSNKTEINYLGDLSTVYYSQIDTQTLGLPPWDPWDEPLYWAYIDYNWAILNPDITESTAATGTMLISSGSNNGLITWHLDLNYREQSTLKEAWQVQYSTVDYPSYLNNKSPLEFKHYICIEDRTIELEPSIDYVPLLVTNRIYSPAIVGGTFHLYSYYYRDEPLVEAGESISAIETNKYNKVRYGVIVSSLENYVDYHRDFDAEYLSGYRFCHDIVLGDQTYKCNGDFYLINKNPIYFNQAKYPRGE